MSPSHPKISIIIATYNVEAYLEECLCSIIEQQYKNVEILIVDGSSTDNTLEIINQYRNKLAWYISEPDQGIYDAWNKAIPHACGDWILFRGADDFFYAEDSLNKAIIHLEKLDDNIIIAYGLLALFDINDHFTGFYGNSWKTTKSKMKARMAIPHPATFHRKSCFDIYGLFKTSYQIAGDYEYLMRLIKQQPDAFYFIADTIITAFRQCGCSSRKDIRRYYENYLIKLKHNSIHRYPLLTKQFLGCFAEIKLNFLFRNYKSSITALQTPINACSEQYESISHRPSLSWITKHPILRTISPKN